MIHHPAEADLMAQMHRRLRARIGEQGPAPLPPPEYRPPVDAAQSARSRRTCHGYSLYTRPRTAPPKDSGAAGSKRTEPPILKQGMRFSAASL